MTTRTHARAMKAALDAATGLTPADAPLVELAKTLAAHRLLRAAWAVDPAGRHLPELSTRLGGPCRAGCRGTGQ